MSDEQEYACGPDEEKYKRLSTPVDVHTAKVAIEKFANELAILREKHGISELTVVIGKYIVREQKKELMTHVVGLGDSNVAAELGVVGYQTFSLPYIQHAAKLLASIQPEEPKTE